MAMNVDSRDVAFSIATAGVVFIDFLVLVFTFLKRNYPPLKAKNLPLIYATFFGQVLWWAGNVSVNNSTWMPKSRMICIVMWAWVRMSFGTFLWVALFQLRIWQYLLIFRWKQRAVGRYLLWPAIYVFILIVPYTVAAILFPPSIGFEYFPENNDCVTKAPVYMFAIAIIVIELCSAIALTYLARNINTCFREFREIVIIISTTVAATVASIIVRWIPNTTGSKFYKGMLDTSFMLIAAQLYLIVLLSKPIYHSIVDPNEYVEYFMHRLRAQNLMQEYSISNAGQFDNLTSTLRTSTTVAASRHSWLGGPNRRESALNAYHALEEINEGHSSSNSNSNSNQYIRKLV